MLKYVLYKSELGMIENCVTDINGKLLFSKINSSAKACHRLNFAHAAPIQTDDNLMCSQTYFLCLIYFHFGCILHASNLFGIVFIKNKSSLSIHFFVLCFFTNRSWLVMSKRRLVLLGNELELNIEQVLCNAMVSLLYRLGVK